MSTKVSCVYCTNNECEEVPYPKGQRFICQKCGEEYYDSEAMDYRLDQRKRLHKLLEDLGKWETEH